MTCGLRSLRWIPVLVLIALALVEAPHVVKQLVG